MQRFIGIFAFMLFSASYLAWYWMPYLTIVQSVPALEWIARHGAAGGTLVLCLGHILAKRK